ncbi:MAG: YfhO family protein [Desulfonatronovibrio sp.]
MLIISTVLYHQYLFQDQLFMFMDVGSDTLRAYFPSLYYFAGQLEQANAYSFHHGLGSDYLFRYITYLVDPFSLILGLAGPKNLPWLLVYVNIFKILICGFVFYHFLKLLNIGSYASMLVALMLAFNGYMILWGQHYHFGTYMVYLCFLFYSTELFFQQNKKLLLVISLLFCLQSLYLFFQTAIFIFLYICFRSIYHQSLFSFFIKKTLQYGLIAGFTFFLSAIWNFPALYFLFDSPRISMDVENSFNLAGLFSLHSLKYYLTTAGRIISSDFTGHASGYFGYFNYYEAPQLYSGLLTLVCIPLIFAMKTRSCRRSCLFLACCSALLLLFPAFPLVFNAMQTMAFRWTSGVIILHLIIAAAVLDQLISGKIPLKSVYRSCLALLILVTLLYLAVNYFLEPASRENASAAALAAGLFILFYFFLFRYSFNHSSRLKVLLLVVVALELAVLNYPALNCRQTVPADDIPYFDNAYKAVSKIRTRDQAPFYRVDKEFYSVRGNDSLVQDYFGLKSYSSLNPAPSLEFARFFGLNDGQMRHFPARGSRLNRFNLMDILAVKYFLSEKPRIPANYEPVDRTRNVFVYKNRLFRPLGFMYYSYTLKNQAQELPPSLKDVRIQSSVIIEPEHRELFSSCIPGYQENRLSGVLLLQAARTENMQLLRTVLNQHKVNINHHDWHGSTALHLSAARNSLDMAELLLEHGADPLLVDSSRQTPLDLALAAENRAMVNLLQRYAEKNRLQVLNIHDFKPSSIAGSVDTPRDGVLFLSIPYSQGWSATVDGKPASLYKVNAGFTGLPLRAGQHAIQLKYMTPYFREGLLVSLTFLIAAVILHFASKAKCKIRSFVFFYSFINVCSVLCPMLQDIHLPPLPA